jgi:hypothetical protein
VQEPGHLRVNNHHQQENIFLSSLQAFLYAHECKKQQKANTVKRENEGERKVDKNYMGIELEKNTNGNMKRRMNEVD